ncbi:MAG TPA: nucleotide pyrophosphatase/phosphodiesterase family protein [Pilimelia sp.]|nr:nucleotide pyrophosphatase/phosphodiesterase family protein [Pilimelia sp.]
MEPFDTVAPAYGTGSLAEVMPTALAALGVPGQPDALGLTPALAGVRRIALLLIDGLGHFQLPTAAPHAPTLAELATGRYGAAEVLTTGFPSTTPTSLVTLGTGAAPGAHGVLGFNVNVPGTSRVLNHVEWWNDPDPRMWQPVPTGLELAAAAGVTVTVVSRPEFAGTGLTEAANRGGEFRGARGADALAAEILDALAGSEERTLVSAYTPEVDRTGHLFGVDSLPWRAAVAEVDRLLTIVLDGLPPDAALLVTADHGQLDVPPDGRYDVDTDPELRAGVAVVAGEPRVRYLHTVPGATADVVAAWRAKLGDAAWVAERDEAVAAGWFGPMPADHLRRVGDVVAACRDRAVVVASRTEKVIASKLVAYHGSFTAMEMAIPLLVARPA